MDAPGKARRFDGDTIRMQKAYMFLMNQGALQATVLEIYFVNFGERTGNEKKRRRR